MIEDAIVALLQADPVAGPILGKRIQPEETPAEAFPKATYTMVSEVADSVLDGTIVSMQAAYELLFASRSKRQLQTLLRRMPHTFNLLEKSSSGVVIRTADVDDANDETVGISVYEDAGGTFYAGACRVVFNYEEAI